MRERSPQILRYINLFRHVLNPSKYLALKLGFTREDPLEFILKDGLRLRVPKIRLHDFKMIIMDNCYLKGFKSNAFTDIAEMVVVDVGANLGFFSLYVKSIFPDAKVYCVEPLEENYDFLLQNIHMNGRIADSLITLKAAICSESGTITLYASKNQRFLTAASVLRTNCETIRYQVPALSFADFCSQYSLDEVSLLKLDCEGAEYDILYNCSQADLEKVDNIAIEVHKGAGDQENIEALSSFLNKTGFTCCVASDRKFVWASRDANKLARRTS